MLSSASGDTAPDVRQYSHDFTISQKRRLCSLDQAYYGICCIRRCSTTTLICGPPLFSSQVQLTLATISIKSSQHCQPFQTPTQDSDSECKSFETR